MTDERREALRRRNERIVQAVLDKEKQVCPGAIDLIGVCGSFATGDIHERSDLDLAIVINRPEGWRVARSFVLEDVGFDLYCTPWEALEREAGYESPYIAKLMDMRVTYAANAEAEKRLEALRAKARAAMDGPLTRADWPRVQAEDALALQAYGEAMLADDAADCRAACAELCYHVECAAFLLNKRYVRGSVRRIPEELAALPLRPEGYREAVCVLAAAPDTQALRAEAGRLLRSWRDCLRRAEATLPPRASGVPTGAWEEAVSNWRGKIRLAAETRDAYLLWMSYGSAQQYYDELADEAGAPPMRLWARYAPGDCAASAAGWQTALDEYGATCRALGATPRVYDAPEAFERAYLAPEEDEP